jgi:two-component system, NtrC family, response regulator PilR
MSDPSSQTGSAASGSAARIPPVLKRRIVVLDDETAIQRLLKVILEGEGYEVLTTDDGNVALEKIRQQPVDLIIQDLRMPKMDGLTFLRLVKERHPDIPSIVVTAFGTFDTATEAMRLGAYTHLTKPFDTEEMRQTVSRALQRIEFNRKSPRVSVPFLDIISNTSSIAAITNLIKRVAPTDSTVLISGESGTGKELVARAIHYASLRSDQPFVAINCGAFSETLLESELFGHVKGAFTNAIADRKGVFESADRGTLFLDEVGEMTQAMQVKLLRVLETRTFKPVGGAKDTRFDVRFITATNRNLLQMVAEGQFREDLYYRLNVIPVELPPLRERKDDVPLLAGHFLARFAKRMNKTVSGIDEAVKEKLMAYSWPGNVRELEHTIERAVALARDEKITISDLAGPVLGNSSNPRVSASGLTIAKSPTTQLPPPPAAVISEAAGTDSFPTGAVLLPQEGIDLEKHLLELERAYILQALERCNWNLTETAKLLNMTFRSIRYRVAKLNIERPGKQVE